LRQVEKAGSISGSWTAGVQVRNYGDIALMRFRKRPVHLLSLKKEENNRSPQAGSFIALDLEGC
jgi:hypothetical protein